MVTIDCQKNSNNAGLATFNANAFSKVRSYTACWKCKSTVLFIFNSSEMTENLKCTLFKPSNL